MLFSHLEKWGCFFGDFDVVHKTTNRNHTSNWSKISHFFGNIARYPHIFRIFMGSGCSSYDSVAVPVEYELRELSEIAAAPLSKGDPAFDWRVVSIYHLEKCTRLENNGWKQYSCQGQFYFQDICPRTGNKVGVTYSLWYNVVPERRIFPGVGKY